MIKKTYKIILISDQDCYKLVRKTTGKPSIIVDTEKTTAIVNVKDVSEVETETEAKGGYLIIVSLLITMNCFIYSCR